jgi:hypothetical protein
MKSNIHTAIAALKSELARAEQGLRFYENHVNSLKAALAGLGKVEEGVVQALKSKEAKQQPAIALTKQKIVQPKGPPAKKANVSAKANADLPKTGKEFWLQYITREPRTAAEITRVALEGLGFTPTKDQIKVLKQRAGPSLEAIVKSGMVQDSGAGRERRFILASTGRQASGSARLESTAMH